MADQSKVQPAQKSVLGRAVILVVALGVVGYPLWMLLGTHEVLYIVRGQPGCATAVVYRGSGRGIFGGIAQENVVLPWTGRTHLRGTFEANISLQAPCAAGIEIVVDGRSRALTSGNAAFTPVGPFWAD